MELVRESTVETLQGAMVKVSKNKYHKIGKQEREITKIREIHHYSNNAEQSARNLENK